MEEDAEGRRKVSSMTTPHGALTGAQHEQQGRRPPLGRPPPTTSAGSHTEAGTPRQADRKTYHLGRLPRAAHGGVRRQAPAVWVAVAAPTRALLARRPPPSPARSRGAPPGIPAVTRDRVGCFLKWRPSFGGDLTVWCVPQSCLDWPAASQRTRAGIGQNDRMGTMEVPRRGRRGRRACSVVCRTVLTPGVCEGTNCSAVGKRE